jgi:hypothetical protein
MVCLVGAITDKSTRIGKSPNSRALFQFLAMLQPFSVGASAQHGSLSLQFCEILIGICQ